MNELVDWRSFYLIVGSGAGALIGLQFVVLTLIAERPPLRVAEANAAFSTPTIMYLGTALLLAALLEAPWQSIIPLVIIWSIIGFIGTIYVIIVARRMRKQIVYKPVFIDWLFHFILPMITYLLLLLSAYAALGNFRTALFGIGSASLLFLFIGIHNEWDAVTYHVFFHKGNKNEKNN